MDKENQLIELGSTMANEFGFTKDKFSGYLWRTGDYICISLIISNDPGKGNLRKLFETINEKGFKIKVPTASNRMREIVKKLGYQQTYEHIPEMGCDAEWWVQP